MVTRRGEDLRGNRQAARSLEREQGGEGGGDDARATRTPGHIVMMSSEESRTVEEETEIQMDGRTDGRTDG